MIEDEGVVIPSWARLITAPNPGPMTLDGTNSWVLGHGRVVIVDPGPLDEAHLVELAMSGEVTQILLTHGHPDHSAGAQRLHALTGAPVRSWSREWLQHAEPFELDEEIAIESMSIRVLHTPGHTDDSVSFVVTDDAGSAAVLTGDTILGRGTSVIAHPEGRLGAYFGTLERLQSCGAMVVLPGHGPVSGTAIQQATAYLAHRRDRLEQVKAALAHGAVTASDVVEVVYADVPLNVRGAALLTVEAQLAYLREQSNAN